MAAEGDAELAGRLAAMRADVARIGAQVGAAVPAPDDGYTDLSGDRWSGLKEFFEPPATHRQAATRAPLVACRGARRRARRPRPGRRYRRRQPRRDVGLEHEWLLRGGGPLRRRLRPARDRPELRHGHGTEAVPDTAAQRLADQLDRFAVIVLARARQASGALQRFAVVRIFKGDAPDVVELEVDDQPADQGRLHLLMLDPVATTDVESGSPEPIPSLGTTKGEQGLPGRPLTVAYTYGGEPTMVRELDAGTDPNSVSLPIP